MENYAGRTADSATDSCVSPECEKRLDARVNRRSRGATRFFLRIHLQRRLGYGARKENDYVKYLPLLICA
jgi:hypothetical protein